MFWNDASMIFLWRFHVLGHATEKYSRMNFSWSKFDQSRSNIFVFLFGTFEKMRGAMRNGKCYKWSEIAPVKFLDTISWEILLEKILSMSISEWEVILVGWRIWDKNILNDRESRNSFVALFCSYFNKSTLKSQRRKIVFCSFANFSNTGFKQ